MATDFHKPCDPCPPQDTSAGVELPLFRFGLRQLLIFVALMSLLMAAMATWHGLTALVLLLAALVVVFHLFSTALGTQLRWHANRMQHRDLPRYTFADFNRANASQSTAAPQRSRSPWHLRRSTPLPWLPRLVAAAALFGGLLGVILLNGTIGDRTTPAGVALGSVSFAVVAGWFAFVGYSFLGVFRHGLRDAMAEDHCDRTP